MASTNLEVVISARDQFTATANRVTGSLDRMNASAGRVGRGVGQVAGGFARLAAVGGALAVGGLAAAAKSAIDFEDAFAGVRKTVDASAPELAALNQELRNLSTRIPVKFTDLAGIAAEAGALGVPTAEIAKFTDVVSRLSASTVGLTTDAAAEAFGKLGNVLNIHGPDYERAASALIALGNAGASSEGDIVEVAKRFGAAGAQAGLSTAQVLGFSSAIASMGVEPEAAGTALSRLFQNITLDIATGSKKLKAFADVSGTTIKDFKKAFTNDASGAVQTFLEKLSKMDRFSAAKALKDAGITNIRSINAVLLLARGYEELNRQVDLSTTAYAENTDLASVSAKRFDTLKSRLTELKNSFVLAAVTIGEGMTPAIGRAADRLRDFLSLTTTQNSLKKFGEDIGKAIDSIDWKAVLDGAQTFLDLIRSVVGLLDKLPGQVKLAGAGLIAVLNTPLVGGAVGQIGKGIGNIGLGLLGGAGSLLGGKAGAAAGLFAQPVRVVNWPAGFGSGLPGADGPGGGGGRIGSIIKNAVIPLAVASAAIEFGTFLTGINEARHQIFDEKTGKLRTVRTNLTPDQIEMNQTLAKLAEAARNGDDTAREALAALLEIKHNGGDVLAAIKAPAPGAPGSRANSGVRQVPILEQIFGTHAAASSAFGSKDLKSFRSTPEGAIALFDERIKYLAGAQGSGAGTTGYLSLVQRDISALKTLLPNASDAQKAAITGEIKVLEGILAAKKFTITPETINASKDAKDRMGGLSPDARDELKATAAAQRDAAEQFRIAKQTVPDVRVNGKTTVNVYVTSRDIVTKVTQSSTWGPTSGSAGGGRTPVLQGGV